MNQEITQAQRIQLNTIINSCQGYQNPQDFKIALTDGKGIMYNLRNQIARFSNMSDYYYITDRAEKHLNKLVTDGQLKFKDGKLLRNSKSQKLQFTYEHVTPCCVQLNEIIEAVGPNIFQGNKVDRKVFEDAILPILLKANNVVILTKASNKAKNPLAYSEDKLLVDAGLNSSMPDGWSYNDDDPFERYKVAGLEIPTMIQEMYGSFSR